jgi:hypothetical protein
METVAGSHDREDCKRRQHQDLLNGDRDKRLTRSAKLKMDQHRTSDDGQSTRLVNKGHLCNVRNKAFNQRRYLVRQKVKHNTSSGEQSAKGNVCYCDICGLACIPGLT